MYIRKNMNLVYGACYYMIDFLLKKYSSDKLHALIKNLSSEQFSSSFEKTFGISEQQFFLDFQQAIKDSKNTNSL